MVTGKFFEENVTEERREALRENLTNLPEGAPETEAFFAQTPVRFFDPRYDARPLFEGAEHRPELLKHLMWVLSPRWDVGAAPETLRVPLLLTHGRHDFTVPWVLWEGLPERFPNATFELFERSGHQPFVEEPERFVQVVTDWLAKS